MMLAVVAAMSRRDWVSIGVEFIASNLTVEEFAGSRGIPYSTLKKQATASGWMEKRRASGAQVVREAVELIVDDKAGALAKFDGRMLSIVDSLAFQIEAGAAVADDPSKVKTLASAAKDLQHVYRLALGASTDNQSVQSVVDFEAFVNDKLSGIDFKPKD